MVWPLTRFSLVMISLILREKMSEPPPAEDVQIQVTVLVGTNSPESLLPLELPVELPLEPPQAARDRVISSARVSAISFFMVSFLLLFLYISIFVGKQSGNYA